MVFKKDVPRRLQGKACVWGITMHTQGSYTTRLSQPKGLLCRGSGVEKHTTGSFPWKEPTLFIHAPIGESLGHEDAKRR